MTWSQEISQLITDVDQLTAAANVKKSVIDASVASTEADKNAAATSAVSSTASFATVSTRTQEAEAHKNTALAVYGTTAAQQTAVSSVQASSALTSGFAASGSAALQQDLSGIAAALHRSPNATTAMFIYDTSKDSDGGAWTEKCQNTGWYNEPIMGKWLGPQPSEFYARHVNASVGPPLVVNALKVSDFGMYGNNTIVDNGDGTLTITGGGGSNSTLGGFFAASALFTPSAPSATKTYAVYFTQITNPNNRFFQIGSTGNGGYTDRVFNSEPMYSPLVVGSIFRFANLQVGDKITFSKTVTVREVTTLNTQSGDYFQLETDGKFYRLWKNLLRWSSNPREMSAWQTVSGSVTSDGTLGPNGVALAALITGGPSGANHRQTATISGSGAVTITVKQGTADVITVEAVGQVAFRSTFTFSTKTFSSIGANIIPSYEELSNGWINIKLIATSLALTGSNGPGVGVLNSGQTVYLGRIQLEYGSVVTTYEEKYSDGSTSEVFRGNKRDFPRLAGIVAEAASVTIYDLTEPSRPMWRRFRAIGVSLSNFWFASTPASSVAALNGELCIGLNSASGNYAGMLRLQFPADRTIKHYNGSLLSSLADNIATVNDTLFIPGIIPIQAVPGSVPVNAIAMTVLPDAPTDPVTGIKVPTIALATNTGVSVITSDGKVVNMTHTTGGTGIVRAVSFLENGKIIWGSDVSGSTYTSFYHVNKIPAVSTDYGNYYSPNSTNLEFYASRSWGGGTPAVRFASSDSYMRSSIFANQKNKVFLLSDYFLSGVHGVQRRPRLNGTGGAFTITPTYNTGWMHGDIRRAYLSDTGVGSVTTPELVVNGTFDTDTTGWAAANGGTLSWDTQRAKVVVSGVGQGVTQTSWSPVAGRWYHITFTVTNGAAVARSFAVTFGGFALDGVTVNAGQTSTFTVTGLANSTANLVVRGSGSNISGETFFYDNISVREVVQDRSYKAQGAPVTGTLTKTQLASGTSLVGYSGWSSTNYLREPYSADLDFGTGEFSASAWVNIPVTMPVENFPVVGSELVTNGTFDTDLSGWTNTNFTWVDGKAVSTAGTNSNLSQTLAVTIGKTYKVTATYSAASGGSTLRVSFLGEVVDITTAVTRIVTATTTSIGVIAYGSPATYQGAIDNISVVEVSHALIASRAHSSGPRILLGIDGTGKLTTTAFDGTTTRIVTTSAAYNAAQWLKAEANYTTDGSLAIRVNGREVAVTRGNPLLTLNNTSAVLTIGNSNTLDAPFSGSIALLKLGATVPTVEQSTFMFEQEKQLFRANAASVLPDTTGIIDMSYDDTTDRWVAVSATNESYWNGLVRASVAPVSAGAYSKIIATSGVELSARITSYPGVDITIPSYVLREELVKRSEPATKLNRQIVVYDYIGGFTGNITTGSTAIASVTNLTYPVSLVGARISGTGIPANTTITAVSGTTIYISAAATVTTTGLVISFLDFNLPVGFETENVTSAGVVKQEGATKDYTRLFDGFIETIRFAVAPGATTWVRIQATKSIQ